MYEWNLCSISGCLRSAVLICAMQSQQKTVFAHVLCFQVTWHLQMGSSSQPGPSVDTLFPYQVWIDLMVSVALPEHLCYQGLCSFTFVWPVVYLLQGRRRWTQGLVPVPPCCQGCPVWASSTTWMMMLLRKPMTSLWSLGNKLFESVLEQLMVTSIELHELSISSTWWHYPNLVIMVSFDVS